MLTGAIAQAASPFAKARDQTELGLHATHHRAERDAARVDRQTNAAGFAARDLDLAQLGELLHHFEQMVREMP